MEQLIAVEELQQLQTNIEILEQEVLKQEECVKLAQQAVENAQTERIHQEIRLTNLQGIMLASTEKDLEKAANKVRVAEAFVTIEEDDLREAQADYDEVNQSLVYQQNQLAAKELLLDVAQNELKKAKEPIKNNEYVLDLAKAAKGKVEQAIEEEGGRIATLQAKQHDIQEKKLQQLREIQIAQIRLKDFSSLLATKTAEWHHLQRTAAKIPANLEKVTYLDFLRHLESQGDPAATTALELYQKGADEGIVANSSISIASCLRALEIADAVNHYRCKGGLPVLEVDPYTLPVSQLHVEYVKQSSHIFSHLIPNENISFGFSPAGAVDVWYSEKQTYEQLAGQYDLTLEEFNIDAKEVSQKLSEEDFAKVRHYVQMMDCQVFSISVAYNPVAGIAEAAFLHKENQRLLNSSELALQLRQEAGATISKEDVATKGNEVSRLKVEKDNQESLLLVLQAQYQDSLNEIQTLAKQIEFGKSKVRQLEQLALEKDQKVLEARKALDISRARIAVLVEPKEEAVVKAKRGFIEAKSRFESLKIVRDEKDQVVRLALKDLKEVTNQLEIAQKRLSDYQHAPELVAQLQEILNTTVTDLTEKREKARLASEKLANLKKQLMDKQTRYQALLAQEDEDQLSEESQHPSGSTEAINASKNTGVTETLEKEIPSPKKSRIQSLLLKMKFWK